MASTVWLGEFDTGRLFWRSQFDGGQPRQSGASASLAEFEAKDGPVQLHPEALDAAPQHGDAAGPVRIRVRHVPPLPRPEGLLRNGARTANPRAKAAEARTAVPDLWRVAADWPSPALKSRRGLICATCRMRHRIARSRPVLPPTRPLAS